MSTPHLSWAREAESLKEKARWLSDNPDDQQAGTAWEMFDISIEQICERLADLEGDANRYRALRAAMSSGDHSFIDKLEAAGDAMGFNDLDKLTEEQVDAVFDRALS